MEGLDVETLKNLAVELVCRQQATFADIVGKFQVLKDLLTRTHNQRTSQNGVNVVVADQCQHQKRTNAAPGDIVHA